MFYTTKTELKEKTRMSQAICRMIAQELNVRPEQVNAAVTLIDDGNTVPFIARYRKEVTGGLDDTQLRTLDSRLSYLREMDDRRQTILKSIQEQGKLTPELEQEIAQADSKTRLEDLTYLTNPSVVRKVRSRLRLVLSRSQISFGITHKPSQKAKQANTLMQTKASQTPKLHWMALARSSWSASQKTQTYWKKFATT